MVGRSPFQLFKTVCTLALLGFATPAFAGDVIVNAGRGDVTIQVPASYVDGDPIPLVLLLHGYSSNGGSVEAWMNFGPLVDEFGFLFAHPNGTQDFLGQWFWNATDACCDLFNDGVDDSGYLLDLINLIKTELSVDDARVYLAGHSNGGFMSYRMACDHSGTIAAIASVAGANWLKLSQCAATGPVNVLQIHGTQDATINFWGGCINNCYPGAVRSVQQWAVANSCDRVVDLSPPDIDIEDSIPGDETLVGRITQNCDPGGSSELWGVIGGPHSPALVDDFSRKVVEFFVTHPKP